MKKSVFLYLQILLCLVVKFTTAQPNLTESDPRRGMYVNKFVTYQTLTIYTGSNKLDTANSILGVDANHDGVFEKEDRLLEYCRDNHITSLVLYDLRDVLEPC